jgi:hypothetical protein
VALFPTALGLYGVVLWSGELQGFIVHEMMPGPGGGSWSYYTLLPTTEYQANCVVPASCFLRAASCSSLRAVRRLLAPSYT